MVSNHLAVGRRNRNPPETGGTGVPDRRSGVVVVSGISASSSDGHRKRCFGRYLSTLRMDEHHWHVVVVYHRFSRATQDRPTKAGTAVRGHDDQAQLGSRAELTDQLGQQAVCLQGFCMVAQIGKRSLREGGAV